jgi:hypothetical protein
MDTQSLPFELQNKIFYYCAEHPLAKIFKDSITIRRESCMGEHLMFFWADSDEWFKNTYLDENKMMSFLIESNIKHKNIGKIR